MSRRTGDEGATALEFALLLPAILILSFGLLALGLRMTYRAAGQDAARAAAHYAALTDPTTHAYPSQAQVAAKAAASSVLGATPSTSVAACARQGDTVTVTLTYSLPAVSDAVAAIPFFNWSSLGRSVETARAVCE